MSRIRYCVRNSGTNIAVIKAPDAYNQQMSVCRNNWRRFLALLLCLGATGCVSQTVRVVDMTPPEQFGRVQAEHELLDIGVAVFDPNVPEGYDEQVEQLILPDIRRAESNYMPYRIRLTHRSLSQLAGDDVIVRHSGQIKRDCRNGPDSHQLAIRTLFRAGNGARRLSCGTWTTWHSRREQCSTGTCSRWHEAVTARSAGCDGR